MTLTGSLVLLAAICIITWTAGTVTGNPSPYPHPTLAPSRPSTCGAYGQAPCSFVPAPPGVTPKCASPGTTFCEMTPDYPAYLIKQLIDALGYQGVIADEEQIDFNANKLLEEEEHLHHHYHHFYASMQSAPEEERVKMPPTVKPFTYNAPNRLQKQQQQQQSMPIPQPIYIPKPQYSYRYNSYAKPPGPAGHSKYASGPMATSGGGYFYPPPPPPPPLPLPSAPVTAYSPADWLKRFARDLSDQHRRAVRMASLRRVDETLSPYETEPTPFHLPAGLWNETANERSRRQTGQQREQLCTVRERYITPQTALNTKGNWMFVVNQDTSHQLVKTEICESTECSNLCSLPITYRSRCEQRYAQKRLVTLDPSGRTLYVDTYWFPSCCVCSLYSAV
ncbi:protein spaetzle 5 [Anopheles darlingi]|uniref:protein spaetzle 5 n=1 Tax=Anopheles darlingi TaxID=43151 RepID=UPI0021002C7C|nr:protein spaetzle 5 [Anopheles darlingi]